MIRPDQPCRKPIMFKHLLLPTDGSPLSENAALQGIALASTLGAQVTGLHVSPKFHVLTYRTDMLEDTRSEFEDDTRVHAERYLAFIAQAASARGVRCETVRERSDDVFQVIIDVARSRMCDLIVMASHGRGGVASVLLGSETNRVLTHSGIPVLVWR